MEQKSREELSALLEKLRAGALSSRDTYHAIQTLGHMNFLEARPEVERFLSSTDPELRVVALKVLTRYWQLPEHWSTALHVLQQDPDTDCRMKGTNALGSLKANTSDPITLRVLAQVVSNEQEEALVRQAAYAAMRNIIHPDLREQFYLAAHDIDLTKEVDWKMVNSYLEQQG